MSAERSILHQGNSAGTHKDEHGWHLVEGYRPGVLGTCVRMHADFYARHAGFDAFFEAEVAAGMADFMQRLDRPSNGIWSACVGDRMLGCIVLDGEDLGHGVGHLRWFIVDDGVRGVGIRNALLTATLSFAGASGFDRVELWTFAGLDATRRLYEGAGFALVDEQPGRRWGGEVLEQHFIRPRPSSEPC